MKISIPDTRPFYDGEHHDSFSKKVFKDINPATEEIIATVPESNKEDIEAAITAAQRAFIEWSNLDPVERGSIIAQIAEAISENAEELAWIDVIDAGRPIVDAREDIEAVLRMYRYYSGLPSKIEGSTIPVGKDKLCFTMHEPYGVIGAITAWNYPLFNETAKIAPIIATGNACVLKPAEETPLVALRLAEIIASVPGVPRGLVNVINGPGETTGEDLVANPAIKKITFTGSTDTGKAILQNISTGRIKDTIFELGGKGPVLVFDDANIDGAAKAIAFCVFFNQGQTCTATTRLLVQKNIHDDLVRKILEIASRIVVGDPCSEDTTAGPVVSKAQYDKVNGYISRAIERKEELIWGGPMKKGTGFFVRPTVFDHVSKDSELFTDEIFGPVLSISEFDTIDDAIALANESSYGLACGIWTKDISKMHRASAEIGCGIVWCNSLFMEYPGAPAGGFNNSGYGREFGREAITEYTRLKTIWISADDDFGDWV